jgi:hypothetical protein
VEKFGGKEVGRRGQRGRKEGARRLDKEGPIQERSVTANRAPTSDLP